MTTEHTPQVTMDASSATVVSQSNQEGPGFFGRLLRALVKVILVIVIVGALLAAGWLLFSELQRSFGAVNGRIDRQAEQMIRFQDELDDMASKDEGQVAQIASFEENVTGFDGKLAAVQAALADDLARQVELLDALELRVDDLLVTTEVMTGSIAFLGNGVAVLQGDITDLNSQIDDLGGEMDGLNNNMATLQENEAAFASELEAADVAGLRRAVLTFRLWELVTRARLRIAEGNYGLAASDVELALLALTDLKANSPEQTAEALEQAEFRLRLAAAGIDEDPEAALSDLDIAWGELDLILVTTLGIEPTLESTAVVTSTVSSP